MVGKDDVFRNFQNSFENMKGQFHILEHQVPVKIQLEYFKYSGEVRKEVEPNSANDDYSDFVQYLEDPDFPVEQKKHILSYLATSRSVQAYRILEEYEKHPHENVCEWAYMALMESRIALASEFSEEKQIFISTGLGGRGEKLRFFVLLLAKESKPFEDYQREIIEKEVNYGLMDADGEMERLTIGDRHVELLFLIPIRSNIKATIDKIIIECNQYGDFLADVFTVTNVKEMSEREIAEIVIKYENNKASH